MESRWSTDFFADTLSFCLGARLLLVLLRPILLLVVLLI